MLGILDWGIGGCGLYKLIRQQSDMPIVYLSDSGYTPYGEVKEGRLKERVEKAIVFLRRQNVSHIAIACNAASTVVCSNQNTSTIVEHGIRALRKHAEKKIGLIGGKRTVESEIYLKHNPQIQQSIAQKLSAHIESGCKDPELLDKDLNEILNPLLKSNCLFLACTHYPAIKMLIKTKMPEECIIIDPCTSMADWILNNWNIPSTNNVSDLWYTTGDPKETVESAFSAFKANISNLTKIELNA